MWGIFFLLTRSRFQDDVVLMFLVVFDSRYYFSSCLKPESENISAEESEQGREGRAHGRRGRRTQRRYSLPKWPYGPNNCSTEN